MKQEENFTEVLGGNQTFFFDTYAFVEIVKGNSNYLPYKDAEVVTTKMSLFELYHGFLKDKNEELGKKTIEIYYKFVKDFDEEVIKEAAKLKFKLNKRDLSMTNCIGYTFARQLGIKFLTGDKQFGDMDNVEFVK
ncbi:MAG: PIN domain-containing protein [Nanoarchaeota archaeon]|nr:PIN domain-containing protein [Nanoarchaeota archaeon]